MELCERKPGPNWTRPDRERMAVSGRNRDYRSRVIESIFLGGTGVSRAILSSLFAADTAAATGEKDSRPAPPRGFASRPRPNRGYKSREAHVLARIHLKVEHERVGCVRFDDLGVEFYENGVLAKNRVFVHRFEIESNKKGPGHVRVDALAAFDAQHLRDFEQLHACIHHYLLHPGRSDLGFEFIKDNVMNHEAKGIRRSDRAAQERIGRDFRLREIEAEVRRLRPWRGQFFQSSTPFRSA